MKTTDALLFIFYILSGMTSQAYFVTDVRILLFDQRHNFHIGPTRGLRSK